MEKGLSKGTIKKTLSHLHAVLNIAVGDELILRNPVGRKCGKYYKQAPGGNEEVQPLNAEEVGLLLKTTLRYSPHCYALFLCAIHTGMRASELAGLKWGDIDLKSKFLTVRRSVVRHHIHPTKSGKSRRVDLSDNLLEELLDLRRQRRQEYLKKGINTIPMWVFPNPVGKPLDMDRVKHEHFDKNLTRAGLRRIRLHDLRHTYASLLIQNGESLAYVRDQLGHSSIKITVDVYGHLVPGANRQAVNKLPTINDAPTEALKKASNT